MDVTDAVEIKFDNDWERLKSAIEYLSQWAMDEKSDHDIIDTVVELVPKLMESYKALMKLSDDLAAGWEAYLASQTPGGLYVP